MEITQGIDEKILRKFEFYNYNHAYEIITQSFQSEWKDVVSCLESISISTHELRQSGGNETEIPKKFDKILYPLGWREIRITGDLHTKLYPRKAEQRGKFMDEPFEEKVIYNYIDGHNIDFVKNRVAFDLEWNSKDQTFDRDLMAMRTFYECDVISVGIIVTRAENMNQVFRSVYSRDKNGNWKPISPKYGASTTWMGKLLPRLESRRNGGCPVLAIGMKNTCVEDWTEGYIDEHQS